MATGHAYDSDGGRAVAAAITSLMTGTSYRRSAQVAAVVGPYAGYARNSDAHIRVMRKHAAAVEQIRTFDANDKAIVDLAREEWASGISLGERHGYRNAQASVIAPTGTIGLMMDCDTTGLEPDLALVKNKKLVGGGSMQIVNTQVPRALRSLGYGEEIIEAIEAHIVDHGHVVGAPGLKTEHYDVFDCAMGDRSISAMGHVRMMAAIQPGISGALSKTVNLPDDATVEEIEDVYFQGWKMGLKALAVYRDNCKVGQPLTNSKGKTADAAPEVAAAVAVHAKPERKRLPRKRTSETVSFSVAGAEGYMTTGMYSDGTLGEVFIKMSKQGSTLAGVMDAFSVAISIGLQYGVPLEAYVSKYVNMRFDPAGMTDDEDIRIAQSIMDYLFRRIALDFMPYDVRAQYGVFTAEERTLAVQGGSYDAPAPSDEIVKDDHPTAEQIQAAAPGAPATAAPAERTRPDRGMKIEAPMCLTCGTNTQMQPAGACWVCLGCGNSTGCS
jgi:ribonucleoside-diphosphate reductase alpha chain